MKKVMGRLVLGAAVGILIGYFINLTVNVCVGTGEYMAAMPQLMERCGSPLRAVLLQTLLTAVIGAVFAQASTVFEIAHWSFLRQCAVHFLVTAVFYLPFSAFWWSPTGWESVAGLLGSVLLTYALTIFLQYRRSRRDIRLLNDTLRQRRQARQNNKETMEEEP